MKKKIRLIFLLSVICGAHTASAKTGKILSKGLYQSADNKLWMRCTIGQNYKSNKCEGEAKEFSWFDAKMFAKDYKHGSISGWRLPTALELHKLTTCSTGYTDKVRIPTSFSKKAHVKNLCNEDSTKPTINTNIFPNTPEGLFWSSTADPLQNGFAWYTYFGGGYTGIYNMKVKNHIRLVKDLPSKKSKKTGAK